MMQETYNYSLHWHGTKGMYEVWHKLWLEMLQAAKRLNMPLGTGPARPVQYTVGKAAPLRRQRGGNAGVSGKNKSVHRPDRNRIRIGYNCERIMPITPKQQAEFQDKILNEWASEVLGVLRDKLRAAAGFVPTDTF